MQPDCKCGHNGSSHGGPLNACSECDCQKFEVDQKPDVIDELLPHDVENSSLIFEQGRHNAEALKRLGVLDDEPVDGDLVEVIHDENYEEPQAPFDLKCSECGARFYRAAGHICAGGNPVEAAGMFYDSDERMATMLREATAFVCYPNSIATDADERVAYVVARFALQVLDFKSQSADAQAARNYVLNKPNAVIYNKHGQAG